MLPFFVHEDKWKKGGRLRSESPPPHRGIGILGRKRCIATFVLMSLPCPALDGQASGRCPFQQFSEKAE